MSSGSQSGPRPEVLDLKMGKLGAVLIMKATLCAAMMAVVAGMLAALISL